MNWHDLGFFHWPVEASRLERLLPAGLSLDRYDGRAWLGIVPFYMDQVRPRLCPPAPGLSRFAELNVRTYVTHGRRKGVWFFSLDTTSRLAVWAARQAHLAYYHADIRRGWSKGWCEYRSTRAGRPQDRLAMRYRASGPAFQAEPGSLEEFLTERYYLFSASRRNQLFCGKISHHRWRLHQAEAEIEHNGLFEQLGMQPPGSPPLQHLAYFQAVRAWPIVPVRLLGP